MILSQVAMLDDRSNNKAEAIFHPVRIRIVQALFGGRRLSPCQLVQATGGTPIATLYRHLNRLVAAGIVAVVAQRQARGAIERTYALAGERAADIRPAQLNRLGRDELMRHFTTFVATLLDDYGGYLAQKRCDIVKDSVVLRQEAVNLSASDALHLAKSIRKAIEPYLNIAPSRSRRRYLVTTILFPDTKAS